jgi:hypothetical protein
MADRVTCTPLFEDSSSPPCYSKSGRHPGCSSPQSLDAPHTAMLFLSDRISTPPYSSINLPSSVIPRLCCNFAQQFAHPAELNGTWGGLNGCMSQSWSIARCNIECICILRRSINCSNCFAGESTQLQRVLYASERSDDSNSILSGPFTPRT